MLDFILSLSFTIATIFLIVSPLFILQKIHSIKNNDWTRFRKLFSICARILLYLSILVFAVSKSEIKWAISREQSKKDPFTVVSDTLIIHQTGCSLIPNEGHIYGSSTLDHWDEEFGYSFCTKCQPNKNQHLYIGNKTNNRIHKKDCSYLPYSENRIYFDSLDEASAAGYRIKCDHCFIFD